MGKDVVVIASGETERRSLRHLMAPLLAEGTRLVEVRIPPGGRALKLDMAEKLVKACWYERLDTPPDKFVILVDTDGKDPDEVLRPLREQLQGRVSPSINAQFLFAYHQNPPKPPTPKPKPKPGMAMRSMCCWIELYRAMPTCWAASCSERLG